MSTICKIVIKSGQIKKIIGIVEHHASVASETDSTVDIFPRLYDNFLASYERPSLYFIGLVSGSLVEIQYNSFNFCDGLASALSKELGVRVVVLQHQSIATAGYFALYANGQKVRSISFGDGEIEESFGDLLEFEIEPLGHEIVDEEGNYFCFDVDDLDEYLEALGIETTTYSAEADNWIVVDSMS